MRGDFQKAAEFGVDADMEWKVNNMLSTFASGEVSNQGWQAVGGVRLVW